MRSLGFPELAVIFTIAILLFGGNKVKELGKGLGETIRHLKGAVREAEDAEREIKR